MVWTIYEITLNVFEGFLYAWFVRSMLTPKKAEVPFYFLCSILTAMALSSYLFFQLPSWDTWVYIFVFLYALWFFKNKVIIRLFWPVVMVIIIVGTASVIYFIAAILLKDQIRAIQEPGIIRIIFTMAYNALLFVIFFLLTRFLPKEVNTKPSLLLLIAIDAICIILFDLLFTLYFELKLPAKWLFSFGGLIVVIGALTVLMYYILNQYAKKEEEYRYRERFLRDSASQVQDLRGVYDSMIKLRHDIRAYVNDIQKILEKGDLNGSFPYLEAMEKKTGNLFSTGNTALDSVLSVKLIKMQENHIEFRGSGLHYTGSLSLDDYALCSLISNMLDNAIEALADRKDQSGKRYILLKFNYTAAGLFIICENPLLGIAPVKTKQTFRSRKAEPYHGIGISIMKKIAENVGGQVDIIVDEQLFHVLAFIPN